ncbi:MAG: M18 family aminopeptidase [Lachnospiraceae bacterium]|nr:M18 family aminopeptidase [Lachnospiraceae bacterium]
MGAKNVAQGLLDFIEASPTCYHAVKNVREKLENAGFEALDEKMDYQLIPGKKFYVIRNDSSVIAFVLPQQMPKGFRVMASHSDSPCFKLKENPEVALENAYVKFNVEKYGGMILSTWLDRPLSVAGRVVVKEESGLATKLVDFEEKLCIIPNVAIHFNREMNKGIEYNPQIDMQPLWSANKEDKINSLIAKKLQIDETQILGADLFVYNQEKGCFIGNDDAFIGSPRIDDLGCVYTTLEGFLAAQNTEFITMYCVFDHEEVGSCTRQGADSDFLASTMNRIGVSLNWEKDMPKLMANSLLMSVDNGHALHPNHPEKSDGQNHPLLNKGIVIKYHGNQQYTTDAYTGALVKDICIINDIPYQTYHNRSDIMGGSTLGNISISHCSIPSADIGLPQLAMHSAFETAGTNDIQHLAEFAKYFYQCQ